MAPSGAMASASTSSSEVSARPTSLPSKYIAQLPAVVAPSEAGVRAMTSSSSPLTPFAVNAPVSETSTLPSGSSSTPSTPSVLVASPTSLASGEGRRGPAVAGAAEGADVLIAGPPPPDGLVELQREVEDGPLRGRGWRRRSAGGGRRAGSGRGRGRLCWRGRRSGRGRWSGR